MTALDKAGLVALAERVEALAGPCRETDRAIWHDHFGHCRHANTVRSGAQSDTGFDCVDCGADSWGNKSKAPYPVGDRLNDAAPAFTASLDAAMTLVPEGWATRLAVEDRHSHSWGWTLRGGYGVDAHGRAATPALALTAAALRAIAAGQP